MATNAGATSRCENWDGSYVEFAQWLENRADPDWLNPLTVTPTNDSSRTNVAPPSVISAHEPLRRGICLVVLLTSTRTMPKTAGRPRYALELTAVPCRGPLARTRPSRQTSQQSPHPTGFVVDGRVWNFQPRHQASHLSNGRTYFSIRPASLSYDNTPLQYPNHDLYCRDSALRGIQQYARPAER